MITKDDDPPKRLLLIILLLPLLVLARGDITRDIVAEIKIEEREETQQLATIEGNTLLPNAPHYLIKTYTLATLVESQTDLMDRIIGCEGDKNPKVCNQRFGCIAGMGKCQIISGTWNGTLEKIIEVGDYLPERCNVKVSWQEQDLIPEAKRTHPIFDEECNRIVGKWLLENEGSHHWDQSKHCWSKI